MLQIEEGDLGMFPFRPFRKTVSLKARILTEEDYNRMNGVIETLEGTVAFVPGDYLLQGVQNEEWPISQHHFRKAYERVSEPDMEGFALHRANNVRHAHQMLEDFVVTRENGDILKGNAGDYLVQHNDTPWVVKQDIFECTYEAVS